MSYQLADSYYIKAYDNYPFNLEDAVEALQYAMSYNPEHAGVLCLMARLNADYLHQVEKAEEMFERALAVDVRYPEIYPHYTDLLLQLRDFEKVIRLADFASEIRGVSLCGMLHRKALAFEGLKEFKKAKKTLKLAVAESFYDESIEFYQKELKRVKGKMEEKKR